MTEAIYLEVSEKTDAAKSEQRRVSVSGMLKYLGVSRSGSWNVIQSIPYQEMDFYLVPFALYAQSAYPSLGIKCSYPT